MKSSENEGEVILEHLENLLIKTDKNITLPLLKGGKVIFLRLARGITGILPVPKINNFPFPVPLPFQRIYAIIIM